MSRKYLLLCSLVIPALLCVTAAFALSKPLAAHADIVNGKGDKVGTATFSAAKTGVRIVLNVTHLDPGMHGVHIHTVGKCEGPAFTTAGGHFNPEMRMHGKDNPQGPHAGDLPNLVVDKTGKGRATILADHVTLGEGPNSLFHDGGTALVIHATADDYKTDPSGNSGARIACGVIQKQP